MRRLYPNLCAGEELHHLTDGQEKESPTQVPEKEHPGNRGESLCYIVMETKGK